MTIIAAIRCSNEVLMGADSASTLGPSLEYLVRADPKIIRHGELVIGVTGHYRTTQILEFKTNFPPIPAEAGRGWMVQSFVPAVQQAFYAENWEPGTGPGSLLVAFRTSLFRVILQDWGVVEGVSYDAIGSGGPIALGCLYGSAGTQANPADRLWSSLEAASCHNMAVRPPFVFHSTLIRYAASSWDIDERRQFVQDYLLAAEHMLSTVDGEN